MSNNRGTYEASHVLTLIMVYQSPLNGDHWVLYMRTGLVGLSRSLNNILHRLGLDYAPFPRDGETLSTIRKAGFLQLLFVSLQASELISLADALA